MSQELIKKDLAPLEEGLVYEELYLMRSLALNRGILLLCHTEHSASVSYRSTEHSASVSYRTFCFCVIQNILLLCHTEHSASVSYRTFCFCVIQNIFQNLSMKGTILQSERGKFDFDHLFAVSTIFLKR